MLRRALILLILLSVNAVAQPTSEPTPMAQAVAAVKLKPKWQGIEIAAEKPKNYRLELNYKPSSPAIGQAEVSADLKEVARVVLGELVKQGKYPASDWIYVSVYAYQEPGGGETGKSLVRPLGSVSCNSTRQEADSPSSSGSRPGSPGAGSQPERAS